MFLVFSRKHDPPTRESLEVYNLSKNNCNQFLPEIQTDIIYIKMWKRILPEVVLFLYCLDFSQFLLVPALCLPFECENQSSPVRNFFQPAWGCPEYPSINAEPVFGTLQMERKPMINIEAEIRIGAIYYVHRTINFELQKRLFRLFDERLQNALKQHNDYRCQK